jgi:transcriptional regulator with XRE-family HTH domain
MPCRVANQVRVEGLSPYFAPEFVKPAAGLSAHTWVNRDVVIEVMTPTVSPIPEALKGRKINPPHAREPGWMGHDAGGCLVRDNFGVIIQTRWRELGDFLRARRAELRPEDYGLAVAGSVRRVPGLRREEIAKVATISTEYYTRLEQGRLPASAPVLADLARVMRLNADHRAYLFELAGKVIPDPERPPRQRVQAPLQRTLDDLATTPAFVLGRRTEIIGWNALGAALITDFGAIPEPERNFIRLLFTDPAMRQLYADWPGVVELAIAQLRMDSARYPDDPVLAALVEELGDRDPEFTRMWTTHKVASRGTGSKVLHHPRVGDLSLDWEILSSAKDPDQLIVIWTAESGTPSHDRLQKLAALTR